MTSRDFCTNKIVCVSQRHKNGSSWSYMHKKRPNHGIYYITRGTCEYVMKDGEKQKFCKGDIIYLPKGINYEVYFDNITENNETYMESSYLINFELSDSNLCESAFSNTIKCIYSDSDGVLEEKFKNIVSLYFKNKILKTKSEFYSILAQIADTHQNEINSLLWEVVKYIDENFNKQITIGDLVKMCAVSETSFRRIFKSATGKSPVKYINDLKIVKAKELLKNSEISIEEIASLLCFYDKSYFCKIFKKQVGCTPSQYRIKNSDIMK